MGSVRISQCMIVKNEEKNIRKALSWGKEIMWEQIVVDTGSTDRTVEIAKEMGAKVYHFAWIQDFSAAKNFALSKAQGDWIAFLDADEYMTEEWAFKLPELLNELHQTDYIAVSGPLADIGDAKEVLSVARQWRFFRNMPGLCYQNPIHEILVLEGKLIAKGRVWDTGDDFLIYHTGYAKSVSDEKNKKDRNLAILKSELQKRPNDPGVMGYLGDTYQSEGEPEEAEKWFRRAIAAMPVRIDPADERSAATFIYLLQLLAEKEDIESFNHVYENAKKSVPWVYDIDYMAARFFIEQELYEKALHHMQQALQIIETYGESAYGIYLLANIADFWEDMALCYYETGRYKACVEQCVGLLKEDKHRLRALAILLLALQKENQEAVLSFMKSLYVLEELRDRGLLIRAAIQAKAVPFLEVLKPICTAEECEMIEMAEQRINCL